MTCDEFRTYFRQLFELQNRVATDVVMAPEQTSADGLCDAEERKADAGETVDRIVARRIRGDDAVVDPLRWRRLPGQVVACHGATLAVRSRLETP